MATAQEIAAAVATAVANAMQAAPAAPAVAFARAPALINNNLLGRRHGCQLSSCTDNGDGVLLQSSSVYPRRGSV